MNMRELVSAWTVVVGLGCVVAAAVGYGGWRAGLLVGGVAAVVLGVLLGWGEEQTTVDGLLEDGRNDGVTDLGGPGRGDGYGR